MKIFISWSKEPSRQIAEAISQWLPDVIQSLKPWISRDIPAGSRWNSEIAEELATAKFGIICVTKSNQHEPWLLFEAGALAKTFDKQTKVCPYLIDFGKEQLSQGPLVAFQSIKADKEGTWKLIQSINQAMSESGFEPLSDSQLNRNFDRLWPELAIQLKTSIETKVSEEASQPNLLEMMEETLAIARELNRQSSMARAFDDGFNNEVGIGLFSQDNKDVVLTRGRFTGEKVALEELIADIENLYQMDNPRTLRIETSFIQQNTRPAIMRFAIFGRSSALSEVTLIKSTIVQMAINRGITPLFN